MTTSPNAIAELLDDTGALKPLFGRVPLDTLRLALSQLIDGLERLEEVGSWIAQASDWKTEPSSRKAWENTMFGHGGMLETTPLQDFSDGDPTGIGHVQWGPAKVGEMARKDVESAIRLCFDYADRYRQMAQVLATQGQLFLAGQALQSEGLKIHGPTPQISPAPHKRKGPGGR